MIHKWMETLVAEHKLLGRIITLLEKEIDSPKGSPENLKRMTEILELLLDFGDKIHNVKEENHLFPTMIERGVPPSENIHEMLLEHEAERELIARLLLKLPEVDLPRDEMDVLMGKVKEYTTSRKKHIKKENEVLYPLAEKVFLPEDHDRMIKAFQIIDRDVYGENAYSHYALITEHLEVEKTDH